MPSLILEQSHNLIQLVRANHFNFYKEIAKKCLIMSGVHDDYKYLMTDQMEWPNMIYDLQLTNGNTQAVLEQLAINIEASKLPEFVIIDSAFKTDTFNKCAKISGLIPVMRWPAMVYQIPQSVKKLLLPNDFSISQVSDLNGLKEWTSIVNTTLFTREGIKAEIFTPLINSDKFSFLLGKYKDVPVSTMLVHYNDETAGIYMASTLPDFSGKGFMSAILRSLENDASKKDYEYLILEANKQSYQLYLSFGFKDVGNFDIYWKKDK